MDNRFAVSEWIRYADNDLKVIHQLLTFHPPQLEIICYHCQQSAEKMLKAFLVYSTVKPLKKHELDILCDMCIDIEEEFTDISDMCVRLIPYATQPRYPFGLEITEDMMKLAVKDCEKILEFIKSKIELEQPEDK